MDLDGAFRDHNDSLHVLPLRTMPLQTLSLRDARLTKNARLESVVELFRDEAAGQGQLDPYALPQYFDFSGDRGEDLLLIQALSALPSFDVYSVRIALRDFGVDVETIDHLKLSQDMEQRLAGLMAAFTRPLIVKIYGSQTAPEGGLSRIVELFKSPKVQEARRNLETLVEQLEIRLIDLPNFLMRYGDVYLSLSYYEHCLGQIGPLLDEFTQTMRGLRREPGYSGNRDLMNACAIVDQKLVDAQKGVMHILGRFRAETEAMWRDISRERYRKMEATILSYQQGIGGSVCALTVKLNSWAGLKAKSNPRTVAVFVLSSMMQGIERVNRIEPSRPGPQAATGASRY